MDVSHIQLIGGQPEKLLIQHGGQSRFACGLLKREKIEKKKSATAPLFPLPLPIAHCPLHIAAGTKEINKYLKLNTRRVKQR